MAITVTGPLIAESQLRQTKEGIEDKMRYLIEGLDQTKGTAIRYQALANLAGQKNVFYAAPHPDIGGLVCVDILIQPQITSLTKCFATATFAPGTVFGIGGYKVTISGSNGSRTLYFDDDGNPRTVDYTDGNNHTTKAYAPIVVQSPNLILQFEWRQLTSPLPLTKQYRRKLNAVPWQGLEDHTVLCREFGGALVQSQGKAWDCFALFEYDPGFGNGLNGWDVPLIFRDPNLGSASADINPNTDGILTGARSGNGWKLERPYPDDADFNQLFFPDVTI